MDQDVGWWARVVFPGWRDRSGPQYRRLSAAVVDAVESATVARGARLPAERLLADALGVSRGTVVAAMDQLEAAGVVRRRQGSGTFVVGRPGWLEQPAPDPTASLLVRRFTGDGAVDLSLAAPPNADHLPAIDWGEALAGGRSHGLEPQGLLTLRERVAAHMSDRQGLPTSPDQLIITSGGQQALALVVAAASARRGTSVLAGCPMYPGMRSAAATRRATVVPVPGDEAAGVDPEALRRAARGADPAVVYIAPTASNPTGSVMPAIRREAVLEAAAGQRALVVEDLALADLVMEGDTPSPLAALDPSVVAVGSASKVLWSGLRIGWIRADEPLRSSLLSLKSATDLATSVPSQLLAAALFDAIDGAWLTRMHRALAARRDRLGTQLVARLPSWTPAAAPPGGLSWWVRLPVREADSFVHVAASHGVVVAPGSLLCVCGRHHGYVRLSFAQPMDVIDLACERLQSAWEAFSADLAATPHPGERIPTPRAPSPPRRWESVRTA